MKLSSLTTEQAVDVLCELTPYVSNIATDETLLAELRSKVKLPKSASKAEVVAAGAEKITKLIPILLKERKADVLGILAVLNGKTVAEVEKQNFLVTAAQVRDAVKDKDLISFFKSCAAAEVEGE